MEVAVPAKPAPSVKIVGAEPSLAPADLEDGDIKFGTDFRSVYATLLQNWLKTPSTAILGRQFDTLPLIG